MIPSARSGSRLRLVTPFIYLLLSLVCTQVPLLNYLGYEFSALVALIASFLAGFLTISELGRASHHPAADQNGGARTFMPVLPLNLLLLAIPLVVMLVNGLFVQNCSWIEGIGFFLLLPVVSVWFSTGVACFVAVIFRHSRLVFLSFVLITLAYAAAIGYFTPAISSYNFFYGYFPGLTYDEQLGLSWTLVHFRLLTIALGFLFFRLAVLAQGSGSVDGTATKAIALLRACWFPRTRKTTLLVLWGLVCAWFLRAPLGYESTSGYIQSELGSSFQTEHFSIFYSQSSFSDSEIRWVAAEHEFRLGQILGAFNLLHDGRIESYIYPSAEVKSRYIGAGTTNIAKPWSDQIHVTAEDLREVLKHELVHVVASPFGLPIIGASIYPGLIEGLAMAIEWDWGNRTLHEYAAMMRKWGVEPDMMQLMGSIGFAAQHSSVSYVLAGSFCRFLIEKHGIRAMTMLYRSGDYEKIYDRSLADLIGQWHAMVDTLPVTAGSEDVVSVFFRRPPIFEKKCARVIAQRNAEARKEFSEKDYTAAGQLYYQSYREGHGIDALSGYLMSELRSGHHSSLIAVLDTIVLREESPAPFLPLFLPIGDACWKAGDVQRARELYTRVVLADFSETYSEAAKVRMHAIGDSVARMLFLRYVLSDDPDSIRVALLDSVLTRQPTNVLARYLRGKVLFRLKRYDNVVDSLAPVSFMSSDTLLEAIRMKTIGKALFRLERFQEARMFFWQSLNAVSTPAAVNEVSDWIDRCGWFEENSTTYRFSPQ